MKAREEAEQKQKELEEKLKKEEEERSARKKRIEEIMARTRGGGGGGKGGATTPTSTPKKVLSLAQLIVQIYGLGVGVKWVSLPSPSHPIPSCVLYPGHYAGTEPAKLSWPFKPPAKVYSTLTSNVVGKTERGMERME